jgi:hypothetical protein
MKKTFLIASAGLLVALPVRAEPPMNVDDAGTLDKGGLKVEGALSRDDKERGGELVFGFAPIEDLEVGISAARATDRDPDPSTKLRGTGISFKWVPFQNDTGWSLGASFGYGHARVNERSASAKFTEKEYAFSGLATYRFENEQVAHLNLGATRVKAQGDSDTVGTWGVGYEYPIVANLKLTAEVFGEEHAGPDKAVGLRYEIAEGLKISGAVGRGNDRSFGQVGFSWEF